MALSPEATGEALSSPGRVRIALPAEPPSIRIARHAVDRLLAAEPSPELAANLKLVVSELVTNAGVHGSPSGEINLGLTLYYFHAHVSVRSSGRQIDMRMFRTRRAEGGRGLDIVAALSDGWSIETGPSGTTVTARVPRPRVSA